MLRKILIGVGLGIILSSLAGCFPTAEKYSAKVKSWVSSSESELVSSWGIPDGVYEDGDKRYLTYNSSRTVHIAGTSPTYTTNLIGSTLYTNSYGGSSGYNINKNCKTTFTVVKKVIIDWTWKGNDCTST